jgi:hypothetical protein
MRSSSAGARAVTASTVKEGELPATARSLRFVSPSVRKASLRMWSMRPERLRSLATVKSHAV